MPPPPPRCYRTCCRRRCGGGAAAARSGGAIDADADADADEEEVVEEERRRAGTPRVVGDRRLLRREVAERMRADLEVLRVLVGRGRARGIPLGCAERALDLF